MPFTHVQVKLLSLEAAVAETNFSDALKILLNQIIVIRYLPDIFFCCVLNANANGICVIDVQPKNNCVKHVFNVPLHCALKGIHLTQHHFGIC